MKGGLNKIMRNLKSSVKGSEFEKRLFKASYDGDWKEPKEKHLQFIQECFSSDHNTYISTEEVYEFFMERLSQTTKEMSSNTKMYTILHRCMTSE